MRPCQQAVKVWVNTMAEKDVVCPECEKVVRIRDSAHFASHHIKLSSWLCPLCEYSRGSDRGHDVRKHITAVHGGKVKPVARFAPLVSSSSQQQAGGHQSRDARSHHRSGEESPARKRSRGSHPSTSREHRDQREPRRHEPRGYAATGYSTRPRSSSTSASPGGRAPSAKDSAREPGGPPPETTVTAAAARPSSSTRAPSSLPSPGGRAPTPKDSSTREPEGPPPETAKEAAARARAALVASSHPVSQEYTTLVIDG